MMLCSRYAFKPAKTQVKPPVESSACFTSTSPSPLKPEFVILTNVASFPNGVKIHSTVVGEPYPDHSMRMRLFCSTSFTVTSEEALYISQLHVTCFPASNLPLLLVNQNLVVISGFIKASNTSATGFRISISALATGICVSWRSFIVSFHAIIEELMEIKKFMWVLPHPQAP